jgi:uncharacterized C2H2 Zn-finger protein
MARTITNLSAPIIFDDGVSRPCWACDMHGIRTELVATADMLGGNRWWKCPKCGARMQWVDNPAMDGSVAEKHKVKGAFSTSSMLSDPDCTVYLPDTRAVYNGVEYGTPLFVYDEHGNKTHRWHWGRREWVKREQT